jgi:hypothetical protein
MGSRYRRAGGHTSLWMGTFILSMGSGLGVGLWLSRKIGGLAFVLSALIFGAGLFVGMALGGRRHHARKRSIRRYLEGEGYTFELSPTLDSFGSFAFLIEWGEWGKWIAARELKWIARTDGHLLMEREFVIMESHDVLVENNCTLGFVLNPGL